MAQTGPSFYSIGGIEELFEDRDRLRLISKVLKVYMAVGKTKEEFAEEYGCEFILDESNNGIKDIKFHNDSNETMFMLKYDNDRK